MKETKNIDWLKYNETEFKRNYIRINLEREFSLWIIFLKWEQRLDMDIL